MSIRTWSLDSAGLAPNRRHYALLALLFAAIAIYGSIAPLHLHRQTFAGAVERFRLVLAQPIAVQSRSDWLANCLLQLPFGFCLLASICCDRSCFVALALPLAIGCCIALAVFVEFAQLYFPPRVSSINDIVAQTAGGTAGALFWLLRGQRLTGLARRTWSDFGSRSTAGPLLGLYLFALLIVQTLPFDFTLSPVELYHKYKEGRVHLLPFTAPDAGVFATIDKHFWNLALFVPVGVLLANLPGRANRNGAFVLVFGLSASAAIEIAQLLPVSHFFDATDILTGTAAVFAGWFVARRFAGQAIRPGFRRVLLAACLAVLIFMEWQPFNFAPSLSQAGSRWHQTSVLPFIDYLQGNYLNSLDDGIHKLLLFVPLGMLLAPTIPASRRTILFRWSLIVAVTVVLETGQLFLPTRYASVSDVLVGGLAGGIGVLLSIRPHNRAPESVAIEITYECVASSRGIESAP